MVLLYHRDSCLVCVMWWVMWRWEVWKSNQHTHSLCLICGSGGRHKETTTILTKEEPKTEEKKAKRNTKNEQERKEKKKVLIFFEWRYLMSSFIIYFPFTLSPHSLSSYSLYLYTIYSPATVWINPGLNFPTSSSFIFSCLFFILMPLCCLCWYCCCAISLFVPITGYNTSTHHKNNTEGWRRRRLPTHRLRERLRRQKGKKGKETWQRYLGDF